MAAKDKTVKVTLRRSLIGEKPKTRATVRGLGLRRINQTVEQVDGPVLRGMLARISHLVEVEES
ncbi:MAG: 50S ribosomal protein L30 [Acidimicrobiales bacterium]|jgi:large subunit ribosomal protein L30|nr:50S ribosomal protein L30 [Acidimicrobiales bacterium]HLV90845.1 50S ribosomal protein L30 [Acidimicrobiia bacterium]